MAKKILLVCEGSYPISGGGLSTWADMLCSYIKGYEFIIYSISSEYVRNTKFKLTKNTSQFKQVPIWGVGEPEDSIDYDSSSLALVKKKYRTSNEVVKEKFIPLFEDFLDYVYSNTDSTEKFSLTIYEMWKFFGIMTTREHLEADWSGKLLKQKPWDRSNSLIWAMLV